MTTKIITAQELRSGNIELPASGGAPDFSAAALADARIVPLQGGQSVDLRGLIEPGATLGWQGPNLVVVSPSGEMVVLQDFLSLVGNAAIMTLQVGSREPGAAVQTLVLAQHDNKLVWQSTFLSTLAWQEATLKSASVLRATVAPVAYKTPDEVVMHETAFKSTRAIDMLRLLETAVAPLASAPKTSPEQLAAPLADGGAAGDSGFLTDAPPTAEILIAPDVPMALYEPSEVSTPVAANGVPVTGVDTLRVKEGDGASTVQVLDNDYDPEYRTEPGTQSLTLLSAVAAHGRVTFTADGVVSYQPDPDFSGTDEVVYQVRDRDGMVSEGRVQVTVEGVNDLPTLQMPAAQTAVEDQALALSGLSVTDPDSVLTVTLQVAHGRLDVQGFSGQSITGNGTMQVVLRGTADQINAVLQAANGLTYTPATDFNGTDALNMVVADEFGQTTHSTSITVNAVNDAPVRTSGPLPTAVVVNEDSANTTAVSLGLTGVTYGPGGGTDEASQTLSYKIKTIPTYLTLFKADGTTAVLAGEALTLAELQGLTYKTVGDANGTGQVEWTVQDSSGDASTDTITESFAVTVNAVNDAPVRTSGALPAAVVVNEDSANTTAVSLGLTGVTYGPGGGADEASQTLTYKIKTIPAFMTLFKADGTTPVSAGDALTLGELQGLTYKTVGDAYGTGQVEWTVQDSGGGSTSTITESFAVTVNAVNDAPVRTSGALPTAITVDEDSANTTAVSLGLTGVTYGPGGGADEASQTLTYKIKTIPAYLKLFKADGITPVLAGDALTLAELQGLTYKTVGDAYGTGQVEWTVQDSGGGSTDTVTEGMTITVNSLNPVNNAPERTSGPLPAAITVDEDSATTTAASLGLTSVTYGPGGGTDEAGQTLTYKIKTIPAFMTLFKADGTTPVSAGDALTLAELQGLTYKTVGDANGTGQVEWTVQDSGGGSTDTITESFVVTVNAVNDAPVRTSGALPAAISVNEDSANTTAVSLGLTSVTYGPGGGTDEASQTLSYKIKTIPVFMTLFKADGTTAVLAGDALTLAELQGLTYKTVGDANGTGQVEWTVQDSSGDATTDTITESLAITVNAVNDAPVRTSGALPTAITVDEDSANTTAVSLGLTGVTYGPGGGTDEASQTLTYKIKTISAFMTLFKADGTTPVSAGDALTMAELQGLTYKTVGDVNGTGQVEWTVQDSGGGSTDTITESFTVTVNAVNDAPVRTSGALPAAVVVNEDSANTTAVSLGLTGVTYGPGGGTDEASQTLTYKIKTIPAFMTLFKADGTTPVSAGDALTLAELQGLTYKTVGDANGTGQVEWTVQDSSGDASTDTITESFTVTVNAVNDAPTRTSGALPTAITVDEDSANTTAVSLGLTGVTYGPGGGTDEASQTLTYKIKTISAFMTLFKADGTTPVSAGDALTMAELQGLTYKTVGDANGTGQVEWTVQDSGGGSTDTITESFTVTVNAVNDAPVRTSGALPVVPLILKDSANSTAVSLGLSSLAYGPGGGADEVPQTLTYSITAIPSFLLLFKADGTAVQKDDVLSAAELAGLTYKTKLAESGSGTIEWLVKDDGGGTTDSLPQSLAVKVASDLVVTQENLEITHTNSAGDIVSDFEWRSGDTLTVKWFDKASGTYLGDQNEPAFDVTRVAVDLSAWGLGVVQATETAPGSGVWAYSWTLSADVTDPQTLLSQVKVQAFGTLPHDTVELHSAEVLVNRMVLGTEDSMVVGTRDGDVFVMPETSTSGAVVLGGDGNDVLDYRAVKTALTLDVQSDWVTHAALGLTDTFMSIEEIWFSSKNQTIGVRDSSAAKVTWSTSEGNTVAEIDRDLDGVNDITVVYKGLLLTALEQQQAVVSI